jgi:hypothetical protein
MTKATGNNFSICEIFFHIVLLNTFQFSGVSIVFRRMTNIGSTSKGQKETLELVIQKKEMQGLLQFRHGLNILKKSPLMRINLFRLILFHKMIASSSF